MLCCGMPGSGHAASDGRTTADKSGVERILGNIDQLKARVDGKEHDIQFLTGLLNNAQLQSIIRVHETVVTPDESSCIPPCKTLLELVHEVASMLHSSLNHSKESTQLLHILNSPHFQAFIASHDQVAEKNFVPVLPDIPYEVDEDDDAAVKIIRLVKNPAEPLGATLHVNEETGSVFIARVMHGGVADRCGFIHPGDEIREVNGVSVYGKQPDDVIQLMTNGSGTVTLTLIPNNVDSCLFKECKMRVRAQFSYDPADDRQMPCHEAGLAFHRGDILEIVSQNDTYWWQARRDGDSNHARAGLIPSRLLQERREAAKLQVITSHDSDNKENKAHKGIVRSSPKLNKKTGLKKCKKPAHQQITDVAEQHESEECVSYEEVERYYPTTGQYRPIILIGPPGVGRTELKRRLISSAPDHFQEPVPYTSRPKRADELDGEEYIFISRTEIENDIQNKRFVEHGEYNGNLYGTMFDQVKSIINSGCVCVMCPSPKALRTLRCAQLKPFVIFIRPVTSLEQLVTSRATASRQFTEDELKEMINAAERVDITYGHYFDLTLVNDDLETSFSQLRFAASAAETEPQWIPAAWLR